jgi:flagellar biosynthetic protein FlhB
MFLSLRDGFLAFGGLFGKDPAAMLAGVFSPLAESCGRILMTVSALAGMDLAMTRYRFSQRMRMTKDEQRREMKDEEGDPTLKGRRKRKHRELAKARARIEVPRADALLVNPTHVAIALRYRRADDKAPRVTAKGKGQLAEIMRDLARSNGIPIVEDIPLARLLHRKVKVGGYVPADTYKAVAAILAFVYRVTGKTAAASR